MTGIKFLIIAISAIFIAGLASAGCFANLTVDANSIQEKTLAFDINWQTAYGTSFGSSQQGFVVPLNSTMIFQNLGTYTLHCENGANAALKPPLKITIKNLTSGTEETILAQQNCEGLGGWCQGGCPVCIGGPVCVTPDPLNVFTFNKEGMYKVHVEFSPWTARSTVITEKNLWMNAVEDFNVFVFSPVLAIHGSIPALLPIQAGKESTTTINWTIQNLSSADLKITDINYPACYNTPSISCAIMPDPEGLKVPANGFLLFTQTVRLSSPPEGYAPRDINMYLNVDYSNDQNGVMNMQKRSMPVTVKIKPLTQQKFSVKIKGPSTNKCYGFNGKTGITGSSAIPRIKQPFDWSWNAISINECDKNYKTAAQDYHYCDAVQFSIELIKKLNRIDSINQSLTPISAGTSEELLRLQSFQAYLMKDGYSKDLQHDLSQLLKSGTLAEVPTWYDDFSKIFEDNNKLSFYLQGKNQGISEAVQLNSDNSSSTVLSEGPGLYDVKILVNYTDSSTKSFILSGNPNAEIRVYFTKISPPAQDSVFYYLPIDGSIGFDSATHSYDRIGYGISAAGKDLMIASEANNRIVLPAGNNSGIGSIAVSDRNEFSYTNIEARGSVLKLSTTASNTYSLFVSKSNATPVLLRVKQGSITAGSSTPSNNASAFYYVKKIASGSNTGDFVSGAVQESYWTGPVSSNIKSKTTGFCLNFDLSKPFNERADSRLDTVPNASNETCNPAGGASNRQVYGFAWQNLQKQSDQNFAYFKSIFYTSNNESYEIFNACSNKDYKIITPTGNMEISQTAGTGSLPLNFDSGVDIETLQKMLDAVKSNDLCITTDSSSLDLWWNESKLYQKLYETIDSDPEFTLNQC